MNKENKEEINWGKEENIEFKIMEEELRKWTEGGEWTEKKYKKEDSKIVSFLSDLDEYDLLGTWRIRKRILKRLERKPEKENKKYEPIESRFDILDF